METIKEVLQTILLGCGCKHEQYEENKDKNISKKKKKTVVSSEKSQP